MAIGFQIPNFGGVASDLGVNSKYPWLDEEDIKQMEASRQMMSIPMTDTQLYQQTLKAKKIKTDFEQKQIVKNNIAYQAEVKNDPILKAKVKKADLDDTIVERGRMLAQAKWIDDTQYDDATMVNKFIGKYGIEKYTNILNDAEKLDDTLPPTGLWTKIQAWWQNLKSDWKESGGLAVQQQQDALAEGADPAGEFMQKSNNEALSKVWDISKFVSNVIRDAATTMAEKTRLWDMTKAVASRIIPWITKESVNAAGKMFMSTDFGKDVTTMWLYRLSQGIDAYGAWKQENPYWAKKLESIFNISSLALDASMLWEGVQLAKVGLERGVKWGLEALGKTTLGKDLKVLAWDTAADLEKRVAQKELDATLEHIRPKLTSKEEKAVAMKEWFAVEWILWEKQITAGARVPGTNYTIWEIAEEAKWVTKWVSALDDMAAVQKVIDTEKTIAETSAKTVKASMAEIDAKIAELEIPLGLKRMTPEMQLTKENIDDIFRKTIQESVDNGDSLLTARKAFDTQIKNTYWDIFKQWNLKPINEYLKQLREVPHDVIEAKLWPVVGKEFRASLTKQSKLIQAKELLSTRVPKQEYQRVIGRAYSWLKEHPVIVAGAVWVAGWGWAIVWAVANPVVWVLGWLWYGGRALWKALRSPAFDRDLIKILRWLEAKLAASPGNKTLQEWIRVLETLKGIPEGKMTNPNTAGIAEKPKINIPEGKMTNPNEPFKGAEGAAKTTSEAVTETSIVDGKAVSDTAISSKAMDYIKKQQKKNMDPTEFIKEQWIKFINSRNLDRKIIRKWKRYTVDVWWRLRSWSTDWWNTRQQELLLNKKHSPTSEEWKEILWHEIWHYLDNITIHEWKYTSSMGVWWLSAKYEPMIRDNFEYLAPEKYVQVQKWEMPLSYAWQPTEILAEWHKKYMRDPEAMKKEKPALAAMYEELQSKYPVFKKILWEKWPTAALDTVLSASEPFNYIVEAVNQWKKLAHIKWVIVWQQQVASSTFTINDLKKFYAKNKEYIYPWYEYTVSTTPHWWDQTTLFLIRLKWHTPLK